jgi:cell division protease FtsH
MNGNNRWRPDKRLSWTHLIWIALAILLVNALLLRTMSPTPVHQVSYSEFKRLLNEDNVEALTMRGYEVSGTLVEPVQIDPAGQTFSRFKTRIPVLGDDSLLALLEDKRVEVKVEPEETGGLWSVLISLLPWVLIIGFWWWIMRRATRNLTGGLGGRGELGKFLKGGARKAEVPAIKFSDVAGQDSAKREVVELVEFLKEPERFRALGAEVPRGVLLMGPPGTGKTLMAKALAGEAGVPFYSISGSEFIEVFVGVGASRVRNLFEEAVKNSPSIIFIDELDSIGRTRGTGLGGGHDEREQTLNQILAEMDGFTGHEAVIVLAATNRPDVLDPALLRPGRFDRHVMLDLPDRNGRLEVLYVHTRKVQLAEDVDLGVLASGTPGFSGADLKNLVNEATMLAAREGVEKVGMPHFDEARDKLLLGTVRTLAIQPEERHRLAVHESGHTLVAHYLPNADPLHKVTIIPRGRALGVTQQLPEIERHTLPEDYLRDRLALMLAGRAAEKEVLGNVSSGADDDIRQATALARSMVTRWGMSEDIGPMDLRDSEEHPFLGREIAQPRSFSESSAQAVDSAVSKLLTEAQARAVDVIRTHRAALDRLNAALEEHETLGREEIEACLNTPSNIRDASGTR